MRVQLKNKTAAATAVPVPKKGKQAAQADAETLASGGDLPSGSAYVEPHSFGGSSLVRDAREAALKLRSLLG